MIGRVETEKQLIEQVKNKAEMARQIKKVHYENMAQVRAWRLNIRRNIAKVQSQSQQSNPDEVNAGVTALNSKFEQLDGVRVTDEQTARTIGAELEELGKRNAEFETSLDKETHKAVVGRVDTDRRITYNVNRIMRYLNRWEDYRVVKAKSDTARETQKEEWRTLRDLKDQLNASAGAELFKLVKTDTDIYIDVERATVERALAEMSARWEDGNYFGGVPFIEIVDLRPILDRRVINDPLDELANVYGQIKAETYGNYGDHMQMEIKKIPAPLKPRDFWIKIGMRYNRVKPVETPTALPEEVVDELLSYTSGDYANTIKAEGTINAFAGEYGTLPLDVSHEVENGLEELKTALEGLQAFAINFGDTNGISEPKIQGLLSGIARLIKASEKQMVAFDNAYAVFEQGVQVLLDWFEQSWYQFGGVPAGDTAYRGRGNASRWNG